MVRELLFSLSKDDFEMQVFRAGGKGGQKQNKTSSGVRIIHRDSGAVGESREERSQLANKKNAFKHLTDSKIFKAWINLKAAEKINNMSFEKKVEESMKPTNLKVEGKNENGEWITIPF